MTPTKHRIGTVVAMIGTFFAVIGGWLWRFGMPDGYWVLLLMAPAFLIMKVIHAVWWKLIPACCPECGNRCRLSDEIVRGDQDEAQQRSVTRYYCPKCKSLT